MHPSRIIFAISDVARCVKVAYDPDDPKNTHTEYKTMDPDIAVGDLVIVETKSRHKMTTGKVESTDIEPDLDSNAEMLWVYSKIDKDAIQSLREQESDAINTVQKLQRMKKRRELRAEWMAGNGEELKALPIYSADDHTKETK